MLIVTINARVLDC